MWRFGAVASVFFVLLVPSARAETYDGPLADTVLYCAFVRNDSEAGTFKALQDRLPEISDLGANALWLLPIHPTGEKERKGAMGSPYAARDYRAVSPDLGTRDDLAALVAAAHARGIKVLLDFVPDHCAWDNPWLSEHPDWFTKDDHGQPRSPVPGWPDVVQLDYGNPAVRAEMRDVMLFWPKQCGIDGYRVDVADMVPDPFWRQTIPVLRAAVTGLVMLAESNGAHLHDVGFDLTYDMGLRDRLVQVCRGERTAVELNGHLAHVRDIYPAGALLMRYTENHDVDRTAAVCPGESARAAAALVFMLPGVPLVYAGQEVGITRRPSLFDKDPVPWREGDASLRTFYHSLARTRREHAALRHGSLVILANDHPGQVVTFSRSFLNESLLVAVNFSATAAAVAVQGVPQPVSLEPWSFALVNLPGANGPAH